jgi:hypothetical protein
MPQEQLKRPRSTQTTLSATGSCGNNTAGLIHYSFIYMSLLIAPPQLIHSNQEAVLSHVNHKTCNHAGMLGKT